MVQVCGEGKEGPEESPGALSQQDIEKPRAHSPVFAAWQSGSLTLHLYLWGGAERQEAGLSVRPAEKKQEACEMSRPLGCPFPLTYPGERNRETLTAVL